MAENIPPGSASKGATTTSVITDSTARGLPYYEKLRRDLRDTIQKKRILDKNIAALEEAIYRNESTYLEETSTAGNIIKGFDNYIKSSTVPTGTASSSATVTGTISGSAAGGGPGAGSRRKATVSDTDRVFSKSSVGYMRDSESGSSAVSTPGNNTNAVGTPTGAGSVRGGGEKKKKKTAAVAEDGETDGKPVKRQKITYARRED